MNVDPFRILIASPPDRERLVAELYLEDEQVAEISQEVIGKFLVEIFPKLSGRPWSFDLSSFQLALNASADCLVGGHISNVGKNV